MRRKEDAHLKSRRHNLEPMAREEAEGHVYVLELHGGFWYVGHTRLLPPERRVLQHFETPGSPAAWTKLHRPARLSEIFPGAASAETAKVQELMQLYGIDAVRGGAWSECELDATSIRALEKIVRHDSGSCTLCGSAEHWFRTCPLRGTARLKTGLSRTAPCGRCGKRGHTTEDCRAYKHKDGRPLPCLYCGRSGHNHSRCYAKTTVDGDPIEFVD
jgi:predicted GIY-YIG superfamily endonuclease